MAEDTQEESNFEVFVEVQANEIVQAKDILDKIKDGKPIEYDHVRIIGDVDINKADLSKDNGKFLISPIIKITDSVFEGRVSFSFSNFQNNVDFSFTKFTKQVAFNQSVFIRNINFIRTQFEGSAHFYWSEFKGRVAFMEAQFSGLATFYGSVFEEDTCFNKARFREDVTFGSRTCLTENRDL
jgi:hypothetical protein